MIEFIAYAATGRLLIWLFQTNGITRRFLQRYTKEGDLVNELVHCDLCLGFWVYLALAVFSKKQESGMWINPVGWITKAGFTTFLVHLIRLGWDSNFPSMQFDDMG